MTKKIRVETFGFTDVEARKKSLARRAEETRKRGLDLIGEADKISGYPELLDGYMEAALEETERLTLEGKIRLDGKTAGALDSRGLGEVCGIVMAPTKVYSSNTDLRLEKVYWADEWVLTLVENLKRAGVTNAGRKKFYDTIAKFPEDKDAILSEAGLVALKHYND